MTRLSRTAIVCAPPPHNRLPTRAKPEIASRFFYRQDRFIAKVSRQDGHTKALLFTFPSTSTRTHTHPCTPNECTAGTKYLPFKRKRASQNTHIHTRCSPLWEKPAAGRCQSKSRNDVAPSLEKKLYSGAEACAGEPRSSVVCPHPRPRTTTREEG